MKSQQLGIAMVIIMFLLTPWLVGWVVYLVNDSHQDEMRQRESRLIRERLMDEIGRGVLIIPHVHGELPVDDPLSAQWEQAPKLDVQMIPQQMAWPVQETMTVLRVDLQAMVDGEMIVWRMSWHDPEPSWNVAEDGFSDAVALQFPLVKDAPFFMGDRNQPVQILHWKAAWQKDIDDHFQDVQDIYPNYWSDMYWFADGDFPFRMPEAFDDETSLLWFPAYKVGNPMSDFRRTNPVEELVAEGFGTLTTQAESVTTGRGVWQEGMWYVVMARPMQTSDALDFQFRSGTEDRISVAVWDGTAGDVGARKQYSNWVDFRILHSWMPQLTQINH